jgi:hypothetical protein
MSSHNELFTEFCCAFHALSIKYRLHSAQEILGFKHKEFLSKARLIDDHFLTNGATQ